MNDSGYAYPSIRRALVSLLAVFLFLPAAAYAADNPFERLAAEAASYFKPMEGSVVSVYNATAIADLGSEGGVKEHMRFTVSRAGAPFTHPVTGEKLGVIESHVGTAEVLEAQAGSSTLQVLSGSPQEGDILRISSAPVRLLFYQFADVGWNISQEYYDALKATGRFEIIDTAPGNASKDEIREEAQSKGAQAALVLTEAKSGEEVVLRQELLWAEGPGEIYAGSAVIGPDLLARLSIGSELFAPQKNYLVVFDVSYGSALMAVGDVDGDGSRELLVGTPSELGFLRMDGPLDKALGGLELKGPSSEEIIWVDLHDLDADGKDELVVTSKRSQSIVSRVYKYSDGKFEVELEKNHFMRVIDGALYGQKNVRGQGYDGPIFRVPWVGAGGGALPDVLELPEGVNIYDFSFIRGEGDERLVIAYDDLGHLNLYDEEGKKTWRSPESFGDPAFEFKKLARGPAHLRPNDSETTSYSHDVWSVKHKIDVIGKTAFAVKRIFLSEKAPGLGIKSSEVVGLRLTGPSFQETSIIRDVPGGIADMSIAGDRAFLLVNPPLGIDAKKLLKGKNPLVSKIYIYSLKGI
ncbi:MAG: VCBS repeat-containing protein [Nitrospirota bacterium]